MKTITKYNISMFFLEVHIVTFFGFARIFSEKSAQACSKRSETFINQKIGTFYIETIPGRRF